MSGPINNIASNIRNYDFRSASIWSNDSKRSRLSSISDTEPHKKNNRPGNSISSRATVEQPRKDLEGLHDVAVRFSVHNETGETMIKIVDKENNEVIREIPSEEELERSEQLRMFVGQLFNTIA